MTTLLHISSSPRGEDSESLALAATFLDELGRQNPAVTVEEWDLWDGTLPPFGPDAAAAKMRVFAADTPVGAEEAAWQRATSAFERFAAADIYLFSLPMWNAGIPYITKQFIDVVSQPGMLFDFDPAVGYTGLLDGKRAVVAYTSGVYGIGRPPSFGSDFQVPYFEDWLRWSGISDITSFGFRPNLATDAPGPARVEAHLAARAAAAEVADSIRSLA